MVGGTEIERTRALTAHLEQGDRHPAAEASEHPARAAVPPGGVCAADAAHGVRMLSVRDGSGVGVAVFGVDGAMIGAVAAGLASPILPAAPFAGSVWLVIPEPELALPEPPPRAS